MGGTAETRVARGAALLDEKMPGWWRKIDLGDLDLGDHCRCVLGQLFEDNYTTGYKWLGHVAGLATNWQDSAYGFESVVPESVPLKQFLVAQQADYAALDEAWIVAIKHRWETLA